MKHCIAAPEILLPVPSVDLSAWAVIACDQRTSDSKYWSELDKYVGDRPSTLRLTLPEIYLDESEERVRSICANVRDYRARGLFRKLPRGFVLVKRKTPFSPVRYGIVLAVDLEAYSYDKKSDALIRATEATILGRIPPRLKIREAVDVEFPHIMLLYNDPKDSVLGPLKGDKNLEKLYDFELNMNGGHIEGRFVPDVKPVIDRFEALIDDGLLFMVGDGNHSLATAKVSWEKIRDTLSEEERAVHPARFALCEAVNIYDDGIRFEAIHRLVKGIDVRRFSASLTLSGDAEGAFVAGGRKHPLSLPSDAASAVAAADEAIANFLALEGGEVDYVHGEQAVLDYTREHDDSAGILLPKMDKSELFGLVAKHGSLPRKTFSMGESEEKRYYIEGKEIKNMSLTVCKFGGSSLADGNNITRVTEILLSDPVRRYAVVSAPGKRYSGDIKVTDLLYACYKESVEKGSCAETFSLIRKRFASIISELGMENFDIESILDETEREIEKRKSADFTASRGEYLNARIVAAKLGWAFVDAADVIFFDENGAFDEKRSYPVLEEVLRSKKNAVIPGFYGTDVNGQIKTFSRGGSDISGSIVARAVNADLYENWTDVSGFLACDPRIVEKPERIEYISFKELRELSYMGANVLHADSIFPVRKGDIPIKIKNTFRPQDPGTLILPFKKYSKSGNIVTGIAGKKDFTVIFLEKSMMNAEIGFARKVLSILEEDGICFEHMPSGIDTLSLVIESRYLADGVLDRLIQQIREAVNPDYVHVLENIALVATVGHGMASNIGTSARLFGALSEANINIRMIDQGSSEINIIVGIDNADYEKCVRAIYREFFKKSE